jgi:hypothetical protein
MTKFVNQPFWQKRKICASHGLTLGEDGATHQILGRYRINENAPEWQ